MEAEEVGKRRADDGRWEDLVAKIKVQRTAAGAAVGTANSSIRAQSGTEVAADVEHSTIGMDIGGVGVSSVNQFWDDVSGEPLRSDLALAARQSELAELARQQAYTTVPVKAVLGFHGKASNRDKVG